MFQSLTGYFNPFKLVYLICFLFGRQAKNIFATPIIIIILVISIDGNRKNSLIVLEGKKLFRNFC